MILLGLTGCIGMGKSMATGILGRLGVAVADTDQIAREVVAPGTPGLGAVRVEFGDSVLLPDGSLDRSGLATRVFAEPEVRKRLEGILHPRIREEWERRVGVWREQGVALGVVAIPLLYETGAENRCDAVLCVACRPEVQQRRLLDRGWSEEHIRQRLAAQWPIEEKIRRADFMVWSEPPPEIHERQIRVLLNRMSM